MLVTQFFLGLIPCCRYLRNLLPSPPPSPPPSLSRHLVRATTTTTTKDYAGRPIITIMAAYLLGFVL